MNKDNPAKDNLTIDIRGNIFKISFVSNWCLFSYNKINAMINKVEKIQKELLKIAERENKKEISESEAEKELEEISKNAEQINEESNSIVELRYEVIKELCETNGYEFNRNFWERRTEPGDLNQFIDACIYKDVKKNSGILRIPATY